MQLMKLRGVSPSDLAIVFSSCALFVFFWAIMDMLFSVGRWIPHLSGWDLIGVIAYTQAFALIESLVLFLAPLGALILLPRKWKPGQFAALCSALVWALSCWAMVAHFRLTQLYSWTWKQYVFWLTAAAISLALICFLVLRYSRLATVIYKVASRISVVSYFYIAFGVLGLFIVFIRNL